ncbi:MAG TPA: hypothetical protein VII64_10325 [Thermodesulfobacteriota bacterium]
MTEHPRTKTKKGAPAKFIGAALVSLGLLNTLLTIKTGESADTLYLIMAALGALLIAAGTWRAR